jgi:DeoR/GlpR family transcriptional regulator of sugar metabolism
VVQQLGQDVALRYDSAPARRQSILDAVKTSGFVSVTDLTRLLGVSDMTVRRDLRKLEQRGKVRVVHGGVSALTRPLHSPTFAGRAETHADGKRVIGEAIARDVSADATIAIDAGTTTYAAVQALPDTFHGTVVTHSIPVMQLLLHRELRRVVGLGGELLPDSQAFIGPRTVDAVKGLRVQTLLLGAAAADHRGIYVASDNERPTKLALMSIADRVVLLLDATKFASGAPVLLCTWDAISTLVTDAPVPSKIKRRLGSLGVHVKVAQQR